MPFGWHGDVPPRPCLMKDSVPQQLWDFRSQAPRDPAAAESCLIQVHTLPGRPHPKTEQWGGIKACLGLLWRDLLSPEHPVGQLRLPLGLHHSSPFPLSFLLPLPPFWGCGSQGHSLVNLLHSKLSQSLFPREPKLKQPLKETRARLCGYRSQHFSPFPDILPSVSENARPKRKLGTPAPGQG